MINRRRFIAISASAIALASLPEKATARWNGRAFGADVSIHLAGASSVPGPALEAARDTILRLEKLFSLYDPSSALSRLNNDQRLKMPPEFVQLVDVCDRVHRLSDGLFDPSVQRLFEVHLGSTEPPSQDRIDATLRRTGWHHVIKRGRELSFNRPDMALTFNGIAQGFASDRVAEVLAAHGFDDATVNIGEYRAGRSPVSVEVQNHRGKTLDQLALQSASVATTSRYGFRFTNGNGHILSATKSRPADFWNTVSVVASSAAMADGLSTALALTPDDELARSLHANGTILKFIGENRRGEIHRAG